MGTPGPSLLGTWESSGLNRRFPVPQKLVATGLLHRETDSSAIAFRPHTSIFVRKMRIKMLLFAPVSHKNSTKTALFRVILHYLSRSCVRTYAYAKVSFSHRSVRI